MVTVVALVPLDDHGARLLCGQPLAAYTASAAHGADVFSDVLLVPRTEGLPEARQGRSEDAFAVLSPTRPFLTPGTIRRAWTRLLDLAENADSVRSVERCREHPAKMWRIEGELLRPLLERPRRETHWHSLPYQRLPEIWVETSTIQIAWRRADGASVRPGERVAPFVLEGVETFAIEFPDDLECAERLVERGVFELPRILEPAR